MASRRPSASTRPNQATAGNASRAAEELAAACRVEDGSDRRSYLKGALFARNAGCHSLSEPHPPRPAAASPSVKEPPIDASITAEVFLGASDRFGCKIEAMINRPSHRRDCGAGRRACAGYAALGAARVYPPGPAPRDAAKHACTLAAGHCLSAGAKSLWKSEQWVCRLDWSACGAWRMALDWAWDAA